MSQRYENVEIDLCGLTLLVDFDYTAGAPATYWQPADAEEVEMVEVRVKCQPEADTDTLLSSIKCNVRLHNGRIDYDDGYKLLEDELFAYVDSLRM